MRGGPALKAMGYEEYVRLSAGGGLVPVHRELPGDLMTPVSAFASVAGRSRRAFLLESVAGGERVARYSFIGRDPLSTLERHDSGLFEETPDGRRGDGARARARRGAPRRRPGSRRSPP